MRKSSTLQVMSAASIYLALLWGYLILDTPQHFAAFSALVLCLAVYFWVREARSLDHAVKINVSQNASGSMEDATVLKDVDEPTLSSSLKKLEALKSELSEQYAQFGKDQTAMNSKSLGTWQRCRKTGRDQG